MFTCVLRSIGKRKRQSFVINVCSLPAKSLTLRECILIVRERIVTKQSCRLIEISYSDCRRFYSDHIVVQSNSPTAGLDHVNADSDNERVNYTHTISSFHCTRSYSEQVSRGFDTSLHHSGYPITNLLIYRV